MAFVEFACAQVHGRSAGAESTACLSISVTVAVVGPPVQQNDLAWRAAWPAHRAPALRSAASVSSMKGSHRLSSPDGFCVPPGTCATTAPKMGAAKASPSAVECCPGGRARMDIAQPARIQRVSSPAPSRNPKLCRDLLHGRALDCGVGRWPFEAAAKIDAPPGGHQGTAVPHAHSAFCYCRDSCEIERRKLIIRSAAETVEGKTASAFERSFTAFYHPFAGDCDIAACGLLCRPAHDGARHAPCGHFQIAMTANEFAEARGFDD